MLKCCPCSTCCWPLDGLSKPGLSMADGLRTRLKSASCGRMHVVYGAVEGLMSWTVRECSENEGADESMDGPRHRNK